MDFLNQAMLALLEQLHTVLGSYALAIITVTVLIRLVLWPMNTAQMKSMKAMQRLQPMMKELQEKYKGEPAKMQQELMKFYSENKFNPMAGCLPMLVQLPIFIALYGALMSPDFMMKAGTESFLFINKLHHTLQSSGGEALDGTFSVDPNDTFVSTDKIRVKLQGQAEAQQVPVNTLRVSDVKKLISVEPRPLIPGEPATFNLFSQDLGYSDTYLKRVEQIQVPLLNNKTRELEPVTLLPNAKGAFTATLPTAKAKATFNFDVLALIVMYGVLTFAYQKTMTALSGATAQEGMQAMMNKIMPLAFTLMMLIIPIPAGVMLYLLVTMVMMLLQNVWIQLREKGGIELKPSQQVIEVNS
jgi:YidC/Oxa1 family membrane protein insertase